MRLCTLLVIVAFAHTARARAATIPSPAVPDLEKKLTEVAKEVLKDDKPVANDASEQELIEQANGVTDIGNNLRKSEQHDKNIPVKVVPVDVKPLLKNYGIEKGNDVIPDGNVNLKREEVDLKHPGPPQRQEHDTQSPEDSNLEQEAITAIKSSIIYTQDNLKEGFNKIKQGIEGLSNDKLPSIQQSIAKLQESFLYQISLLNNTIQSYLPSNSEAAMKNVEKNLEVVEQKFEDGVESLSKGLLNFGSVKQDSSGTDTTTPAGGASNNPFAGVIQSIQSNFAQLQTNFQSQLSNLQQNVQNLVNQAQQGQGSNASGAGPGSIFTNLGNGVQNIIGQENTNKPAESSAQSDTTATDRPGIGQGIQNFFQGIWNRPGAAQGSTQNQQNVQADTPDSSAPVTQPGPIVQAIQSNPIYQGVVNLIQRPQANKPLSTPTKGPEPAATGSGVNAVPAEKPESADPKPEEKQKPTAGPIQQIVQRNPIVQGIAGVAQRIQQTVANPEKPRDAERGHWHKPSSGESGNSDDSGSGVNAAKSEQNIVKEIQPIVEESKEEKIAVSAKTDSV